MSIAAGTRIGSYEVRALIGAGGMGEVYRAHDTRLGRDVALKVLPEAFARDGQRMARFEREAKLLASLNHPNIAALYGIEESGPIRALVMEFVEGPTLAERVLSGAIAIDEALPIARQVADAVEYAHDKNVIHRDLKPANIKVKADGMVKVLDFGLAKAMSNDPTEGDMSNSPTLSMAATRQGMILGTAAYMSPEQARGKVVDRRADVLAFGAVLYEMLTGKPLFSGETMQDTLAAVLQREPDWQALPSAIPPKVRDLLHRCLDRNARQRLRDAGEARILIEGLLSGAATAEAVPSVPARGQERMAWAVAAAAIAVALAGWGAFVYLRPAPAAAPEMRTEIVTPFTSDPVSFALSPDGRQIVYVASGDGPQRLWLRRLDTTSAQPLAGTDADSISMRALDYDRFAEITKGKNALALGPGLGTHPETQQFVRAVLRDSPIPIILDADGLNAFAGRAAELSDRKAPLAVTPHPGEMARLLGCTTAQVQADRLNIALQAAAKWNAMVVLKGYRTIIATPDGRAFINSTGNPGMATGGTGDVLTGMLAGLTAQFSTDRWERVLGLGVYLHGLAGDLAAEDSGEASLISTDLANAIPRAWRDLLAGMGHA